MLYPTYLRAKGKRKEKVFASLVELLKQNAMINQFNHDNSNIRTAILEALNKQ